MCLYISCCFIACSALLPFLHFTEQLLFILFTILHSSLQTQLKIPSHYEKLSKCLTNQLLTISTRLHKHTLKIKLEEGKEKSLTIHKVGSKSSSQKINLSSTKAMKVVLIYIAADVAPGCNLSSCSISVLPHRHCNRENK